MRFAVIAALLAGCGGSAAPSLPRAPLEIAIPSIPEESPPPSVVGSTATSRAAGHGSRRVAVSRRSGPSVAVSVRAPVVTGGGVPDAAAVAEAMVPDLRRCFEPTAQGGRRPAGELAIAAELGAGGDVAWASAVWAMGLPAPAIACVVARVSSARFGPPSTGSATVMIAMDVEML